MRSTSVLVTWIAALALAGPAAATDTKSYAGVGCRGSRPQDAVGYWWDRAYNDSSTSQATIYCPLVRDENGVGTAGIERGWVDVMGWHPTSPVTCTLGSVLTYTDGTLHTRFERRSSQPGGAVVQRLRFPAIYSPAIDEYVLFCYVPPRYQGTSSEILNYQLDEDD